MTDYNESEEFRELERENTELRNEIYRLESDLESAENDKKSLESDNDGLEDKINAVEKEKEELEKELEEKKYILDNFRDDTYIDDVTDLQDKIESLLIKDLEEKLATIVVSNLNNKYNSYEEYRDDILDALIEKYEYFIEDCCYGLAYTTDDEINDINDEMSYGFLIKLLNNFNLNGCYHIHKIDIDDFILRCVDKMSYLDTRTNKISGNTMVTFSNQYIGHIFPLLTYKESYFKLIVKATSDSKRSWFTNINSTINVLGKRLNKIIYHGSYHECENTEDYYETRIVPELRLVFLSLILHNYMLNDIDNMTFMDVNTLTQMSETFDLHSEILSEIISRTKINIWDIIDYNSLKEVVIGGSYTNNVKKHMIAVLENDPIHYLPENKVDRIIINRIKLLCR